jgi:SNF2 family DNA or RNA helicase
MDKLLNFQIPHFLQLEEALSVKKCVVDSSDTGTGKTFIALALAKKMKFEPFIICPKSVINSWKNAAKMIDIEMFGICNYEMLKGCKFYNNEMEKLDFPFVEKVIIDKKTVYDFMLPSNVLVIFDEAHRCKNYKSETSKLMLSIKKSNAKMILLSATLTDKLECFKPFGIVLDFYSDSIGFKHWLQKQKIIHRMKYRNINITDDQLSLKIIHNNIFPKCGSRMKIKELGNLFPSNQILCQAYTSENKEEINKLYEIIKSAFLELKDKELKSNALGKIIRARMKIEMFKVPIMLDVINEGLDANMSVAIFVNYKDTMYSLCHYLNTDCIIHGDQSLNERQESIDRFQNNVSKIIICIIQAGGVGISLHDIHGEHPRMSVISPSWSGQDMQQALGRIHRAGSQSPALQRIVYCADSYEETICELIKKKLSTISQINDSDASGVEMTEEEFREVKESEIKESEGKGESKESKESKEETKGSKGESEGKELEGKGKQKKVLKFKKVTKKKV